MAARRERGLFDLMPNRTSVFDHHIYRIASDGDMEEGISSEASSIAGTQQLGNLTLLYDDNHISIEDNTIIAFNEDIVQRYDAYGWHTSASTGCSTTGGTKRTSPPSTRRTARPKRSRTSRRSSRCARSSPGRRPTPRTPARPTAARGAGSRRPRRSWASIRRGPSMSQDVLEHARKVIERGRAVHAEWDERFAPAPGRTRAGRAVRPDGAARAPDGWADALPTFEADEKGMATRKASGAVLNAIAPELPGCGAGPLTWQSRRTPHPRTSRPSCRRIASRRFPGGPYGRVLHFGIREHAMGAILNGIALHGGTRPYGATFLVFSDYMRPAVRLAA